MFWRPERCIAPSSNITIWYTGQDPKQMVFSIVINSVLEEFDPAWFFDELHESKKTMQIENIILFIGLPFRIEWNQSLFNIVC